MTKDERDFAEQKHELVMDFLRYKRLSMDDFYDIVIFGYLSAVQQYFRKPPAGVTFKAMAFRAMRDSVLQEGEYHARAKRRGLTVSLEDVCGPMLCDSRQDTEKQVEERVLLEQVVHMAALTEAKIILLLLEGFALYEATRFLKMPKAAAASCMERLYGQVSNAIGRDRCYFKEAEYESSSIYP